MYSGKIVSNSNKYLINSLSKIWMVILFNDIYSSMLNGLKLVNIMQ